MFSSTLISDSSSHSLAFNRKAFTCSSIWFSAAPLGNNNNLVRDPLPVAPGIVFDEKHYITGSVTKVGRVLSSPQSFLKGSLGIFFSFPRLRFLVSLRILRNRTSTSKRLTLKFLPVLKKKTPQQASFYFFFFFTKNVSAVIYTEGG